MATSFTETAAQQARDLDAAVARVEEEYEATVAVVRLRHCLNKLCK
jgi:hypothetical protein